MLQALRSTAASFLAKLLFGLLIASFAVWGVGDIIRIQNEAPAAYVGDIKITSAQLSDEFRAEVARLRGVFGEFDTEQARQLGLMDQVLDRMIGAAVFDHAAQDFGIIVPEEVIRKKIIEDPRFRGPLGRFDRSLFAQLLGNNNLTEDRFVALLRRDLVRAQLTGALTAGIQPPATLAESLYRYRNERRVSELAHLDLLQLRPTNDPDEATILEHYETHAAEFMAPAYRALTVVAITLESVRRDAVVTAEQLKDEYESRLDELRTPERREIEQILLPDEATAARAYDKLKQGGKTDEVAAEVNAQNKDSVALGGVNRGDLMEELAAPVFALPEGGVAEPLKSTLGWHVIKVVKVTPSKQPALGEVRERLTADILARLADEMASKLANQLEDELASGATLEVAATKLNLPTFKVAAIDRAGLQPDGTPDSRLTQYRDVLNSAFNTSEGEESRLIEGRDGGYFMVRVNGITPAARRPLDQVRPAIVSAWKAKVAGEAARTKAEAFHARVLAGEDWNAVAQALGFASQVTKPIVRGRADAESGATADLVARLFAMKPGDITAAPGNNGYFVARLREVQPADPATDAEGLKRVREQLTTAMSNDFVNEFAAAMRRRLGVEVNQRVIDGLL